MRLLVQPFSEKSMGKFIIEALSGVHGPFDLFQVAVAFAKRSGVQHIEAKLKEFVGNGKNARIVVGIDLNGTTAEGLEALLNAIGNKGDLLVNHDEDMFVTFHPKIYFFESDDRAILTVGSGNLTAGGLYSNDEGFAILELDKSEAVDQAVIDQYKENFEKWCDEDSELVRRISNTDDIQALVEAGYVPYERNVFVEADEGATPDEDDAIERNNDEEETIPRLFGRMQHRKHAPRRSVSPPPAAPLPPSPPAAPPATPSLSIPLSGFPPYILFDPATNNPTIGIGALSGSVLPSGAVGLIIQLNRDSARHFYNQTGTANISIPVAATISLRFGRYGEHARPRAEYSLLIRYLSTSGSIVIDPLETNVMGYGFTPGESGHGDVRMVVPAGIKILTKILEKQSMYIPEVGDLAMLEWPTHASPVFRFSLIDKGFPFYGEINNIYNYASDNSQLVGGGACWLLPGISPNW